MQLRCCQILPGSLKDKDRSGNKTELVNGNSG